MSPPVDGMGTYREPSRALPDSPRTRPARPPGGVLAGMVRKEQHGELALKRSVEYSFIGVVRHFSGLCWLLQKFPEIMYKLLLVLLSGPSRRIPRSS